MPSPFELPSSTPQAYFASLVKDDDSLPLLEAAASIAQDEYPDLDVQEVLGEVDVLLSRLRRESDVYVLMLTARTEETDKLVGLSVGADDYVTKPFSPREVVARVKAALRRMKTAAGSGTQRDVLSFKHVLIDANARTVLVDNVAIDLTALEFDLLYALAAALAASPEAAAMFERLTSQNRYAILYRLATAKRAETRTRRLGEYVAMLARGETIHPQR